MRKLLFALSSLALLLTGCDDDLASDPDPANAYFNVNPFDDAEIPQTGGSREVTFTTNCKWEVQTQSPWITFSSQSGGAGTSTLTLTIADNASLHDRVDSTFIVSSSSAILPYCIVTKQKGLYFDVDTSALCFYKSGGKETIRVTTDGTYRARIEPSASWLSCRQEGDVVTVEVAPTTDQTVRTAEVIIWLTDLSEEEQKTTQKTIAVTQEYADSWLTFTCDSLQTIRIETAVASLEYSEKSGEWKEMNTDIITFGGDAGQLRLRGKSAYGTSLGFEPDHRVNPDPMVYPINRFIFGNDYEVRCTGDIRTLVDYENYATADLSEARFCSLFDGCQQLTTAPSLGAMTLASECYRSMFADCTSLVTAPTLPAETLAEECYAYMFSGCTSLTAAPTLPAMTLAKECYRRMFDGCTSLVTAPTLPAETLSDYCYWEMFAGCTSLTTAPSLPATTMSDYCYYDMFSGCTSLTSAPTLPSTALSHGCYEGMFAGCTSLTTAPSLPATTMSDDCYYEMFSGCTSLTTAPSLPATTLRDWCYHSMFADCKNLNYVEMLATDISAWLCCESWLSGVSSSGTFVKNKDAQWEDSELVPSGWSIIKK